MRNQIEHGRWPPSATFQTADKRGTSGKVRRDRRLAPPPPLQMRKTVMGGDAVSRECPEDTATRPRGEYRGRGAGADRPPRDVKLAECAQEPGRRRGDFAKNAQLKLACHMAQFLPHPKEKRKEPDAKTTPPAKPKKERPNGECQEGRCDSLIRRSEERRGTYTTIYRGRGERNHRRNRGNYDVRLFEATSEQAAHRRAA